LGAGADRQQEEGPLLGAALAFAGDVDDGAGRDGAARAEGRQAGAGKGGQRREVLLRPAAARLLPLGQAAVLDGDAAVLLLLGLGGERARRLAGILAGALRHSLALVEA